MDRREALKAGGGASVLALAAAAGLFRPGSAFAQEWNKAAFDTRNFADTLKALGGKSSTEKDRASARTADFAAV